MRRFFLFIGITLISILLCETAHTQCDNFVGRWQAPGESFTITQVGNIFKMAYKGPNYSSNEASPCNNGQLENEGMKLTYSSQEDVFYWDGRKFKRIGQKPASSNQITTNNQSSCSGFIGEWVSSSNGKFVITQTGNIFKMAYKGPNYSSNDASPCVNGQLENERMKLTYSSSEDLVYWDGTKFFRSSKSLQDPSSDNSLKFEGTWIDIKARNPNSAAKMIIKKAGQNFAIRAWNFSEASGQELPGIYNKENDYITLGYGATIIHKPITNTLLCWGIEFKKDEQNNNSVTQQSNNTIQQSSNVSTSQPPKEIDYNTFKGYVITEKGNYHIKLVNVSVFGELTSSTFISNKILEILPTLNRISQPQSDVIDTLKFVTNVTLSFSEENSGNGAKAYFANVYYDFVLVSFKSVQIVYINGYSKANTCLLARGFSTKSLAATDVFEKSLNKSLNQFFIGNFPITGNILEITETNRKKDEAKSVKINVGSSSGIAEGYSFLITDYNSGKADLIVKEVFENYSLCKVTENEKTILQDINSGKKLKIKTIYKP